MPTELMFLPSNLEEAGSTQDFMIRGEAATLQKILRLSGIYVEFMNKSGTETRFIHNKSFEWGMPIILFTAEIIRTNPDLISLVLDIVKKHIADLFKGLANSKTISVEIVVEKRKGGTFQKISYEGDLEGLSKLAEMVKETHEKG